MILSRIERETAMPKIEMTPAEARAFRSGGAAQKRGKQRHENPHHCATTRAADKYWAWFAGFDASAAEGP